MFSCLHDSKLERALQLAGANRHELESVISYYETRGDRQKLEAARYLIINMPHHEYMACHIDSFHYRIFDAMKLNDITRKQAIDSLEKNYSFRFYRTNDAETIKAKFLINNIEWAFKVWREAPWGKHISFDHFCREILPYRVGSEPPEEWREHYYLTFQPILDSLLHDGALHTACNLLYDALLVRDWECSMRSFENLGALILLKMNEGGHCETQTQLMTFVMRSVGIAGGIDSYLCAPDRNLPEHSWNYFRDTTGKIFHFDFDVCDMTYNRDTANNHSRHGFIPNHIKRMSSLRKKGKVYRDDFDRTGKKDVSHFPPLFQRTARLRDVTFEYFDKNKITLNIEDHHGQKGLYLCVFNDREWFAVDYMEVKNGKASLNTIEPGVLFIPAFYIRHQLVTAGYPFVYDGEKLHYFIADSSNLEKLILTRKYSMSLTMKRLREYAIGGKFQVSGRADFSDAQTIHEITQEADMMYNAIKLDMKNDYRFIRYLSANNSFCNLAELEIYTPENELLSGKIIGTDGTRWGNEAHTKYAVFDKDPLTYFISKESSGAWVGLDFGKPQKIGKIRYLFRNDDNSIRAGDMYELFYFTPKGWVSCGVRQGPEYEQRLVYEQIPQNALLWLRNHTRGREERIFSYTNNVQVWW